MRGRFFLVVTLLVSVGPSASAAGLDEWQAQRPPRLRIAASPYPNFLLEVLPTGVDFGNHRYRVKIDTLGMGPSNETPRGHFYTRRGGFLDLAHIRRAIDFGGYIHYHVREGLRTGAPGFSFGSIDKSTYHCHFSYPAFWGRLAPSTRERLAEEIAVRAAEEAAIDFSNWREILTWYDFHNLPGMPERGSAFSYEDLPSHSVGAAVLVRALRDPHRPFDEAVTRELDREIEELGIVSEELYRRAMGLVENRWWGKKSCLKRFIDAGKDDGRITPWLVRGLEPGKSPRPKSYPVPRPSYGRVFGYDCRGIVVFECEPHMPKRDRVLSLLGAEVERVRPSRDYPILIEQVRREILSELGPNATRPYP